MITQTDAQPIMVQLKESTRAQHDATEHGAFNEQLMKGRLPREAYVQSLEQLFLIHRALEHHLRRFRTELSAFDRVLRDDQFQEPYLREDLGYFGSKVDSIRPLSSTRKFLERIESIAATQPVALLGIHYVFEGSNNGSKFIAKAVRRAYQLNDTSGTRYLDPYGDRQTETWKHFKEDMNACVFTPQETIAILQAAGDTFLAVMELHRELYETVQHSAEARKPATEKPIGKCPFHHAAMN